MTHLADDQITFINDVIMKKSGVVGFSVVTQKRVKAGKVVDVDVVRIYVKRKAKPDAIKPEDVIDATIMGIPSDVVEVGEIVAQNSARLD